MTRDHDAGLPDAGREALTQSLRRLELDIEDLRFENARLKGSIAEKQDEIMALSDRLGHLQMLLHRRWRTRLRNRLRPLKPLRVLLRRLG
jgi:FtsZ-binding cell division protein ZapB